MFEKIKQDLFTIHGILTTLIHLFFIVGFVTCWIGVNTQILGRDPLAAFQKQESSENQSESPKKKR